MIDYDLSQQLHSLAATADEPFDLAALHRRISAHNRRRTVVKVGFASAGVAAVVGGLFVVNEERPAAVDSQLAVGTSPVASTISQAEPAALPDCAGVLAALPSAKTTPIAVVVKGGQTDTSASPSDVPAFGFKGVATIVAIDGSQITFRSDEPKIAPASSSTGTLDAATVWFDGSTRLDTPQTLKVGDLVGLGTLLATDDVVHVVFVDVSVSAAVAENPTGNTTIVVPGPILPPGPTDKAMGTIDAVAATSISVSLDDRSGQVRTVAIDLAGTPFFAGDTRCAPSSLTVGRSLGVAYHFDDAGNVISDAAMLVP